MSTTPGEDFFQLNKHHKKFPKDKDLKNCGGQEPSKKATQTIPVFDVLNGAHAVHRFDMAC